MTVGMLSVAFGVCQFLFAPILGLLSDRLGRRPLLFLCQLGTAASLIFLATATHLQTIYLARILAGICGGSVTLALAYLADRVSPRDRAAAFVVIGLAYAIGYSAGPGLVGLLVPYGIQVPVLISAALMVIAFIGTYVLTAPEDLAELIRKERPSLRSYLEVLSVSEVRAVLGLLGLLFFSTVVYFHGIAMFAERRFSTLTAPFGAKQIGYLMGYSGAIAVLWQLNIKHVFRLMSQRRVILTAMIAGVIGHFALGLISNPYWFGLIALATTFASTTLRPTLLALLSRNTRAEHQGLTMGIGISINSLAQMIAPIVGAAFINDQALALWAWIPAILYLVSTLLFGMDARFSENKVPLEQPTVAG